MTNAPANPATPTPALSASRRAFWCLLGCYCLAVAWGARSTYATQPSALDLLFPVAFSLILGWWSVSDSLRRRRPIPLLSRPWFVLFAWAAVPGYVVWSRGWRGLLWLALLAFLWYLVATAALHVTGVLLYGERWLRALGL
jgi:hypothetical protein